MSRKRIAVGLSGGVDSSVAAALLNEKGHDVIGISMEIFDGSVAVPHSERHTCYGPEEKDDIESAASVCKDIGIPFHVIDLKKEFSDHVLEYFRKEYLGGRTPNPCVVCNRMLKFGFLLQKAKEAGIDFDLFATGHYARIKKSKGRFLLKRARELSKDQSYFLYALTPKQLSHTLFPLGEYSKDKVRDMARSYGLKTVESPESQDFIAGNDYSTLFGKGEVKEGDIVDEKGDILGTHKGIIHYTIGQRKGLGISSDRPLYVAEIDAECNRIVLSHRDKLFAKGLIAAELNLIAMDRLDSANKAEVKIRIKHKEADATLSPHEDSKAKVVFEEPQMSVTPGQSAVFYSSNTVLGGGIIEKALY